MLSSFSAEARSQISISARNGLGLRFEVGNAGVVVVAWGCDLGVVVAWACRSRRGGGLGLPILPDLRLGLPISA
uniref:Uncharacterized protein n=1 Tax=Fagus sylvatica TaxID=28930 RepID=A0A2N9HPZ7_FAGSY